MEILLLDMWTNHEVTMEWAKKHPQGYIYELFPFLYNIFAIKDIYIYIYTHLQRVPLLYIRKGAMCEFHQGLAESQSQFGRGTSKKGLCLGRSRSLEDGGTIVGYKGFLTLQNHEEMNWKLELKGLFLEPKNWVECFGLVFRIFQLGDIL